MVIREVVACIRVQVYGFVYESDGWTDGRFWIFGNRQPLSLNLCL